MKTPMDESSHLQSGGRLSGRRRLVFGVVAILLSLFVLGGVLVGADLYAHRKLDALGSVNRWGYRGPVLGRKQPGELRVAVLGGSTAYGYGVTEPESIPAYLQQTLAERRRAAGEGPVSVVNLAYNNEGAFAAKYTLIDFAYLEPDVAVFHDGYNDLGSVNFHVFRRDSPIFRLTGYMPVLPLLLREKAMLLRSGSLDDAYWGRKTVFRPNLAQRTTAGALEAADKISQSLERQLGRLTEAPVIDHAESVVIPVKDEARGCGERWGAFCQTVADNIDYALSQGMRVVVIGQPRHAAPVHGEQQTAMAAMVRARYERNAAVRYVDLGTAIDLRDKSLAWDSMHLTAAGNQKFAAQIADPLMEILEDLSGTASARARTAR